MKLNPKKSWRFLARVAGNFSRLSFKEKSYLLLPLAVLALAVWGGSVFFRPEPKALYEAAVMVRDQKSSDPAEDTKNSLKAGDVLILKPAGGNWSQTERISYLILKMELSEEEKTKLLSSDEKEIKVKDLSEEEQQRIEEEKKRAKEEDREYREEPRRETLRLRAYHIDLDKLGRYDEFKDFDPVSLISGQPFPERVFDWGVVERKEKVKK